MEFTERRATAWRQRHVRHIELLLRAGELLDQSLDYQETLQNVCKAAVETVADLCLVDLGPPEAPRLAAAAHRDPTKEAELSATGNLFDPQAGKLLRPLSEVIAKQESILVTDFDEGLIPKTTASNEHVAFMQQMGYRSMMIIPLVSKSEGVLGAMTLVRTSEGPPFDQTDLWFATDLGRRCAAAIVKSLLFAKTLNIAWRFQQAALPRRLPEIPGFALDAVYEPSSVELLVGGDWYDAFEVSHGRIVITIGDVLGHGIDAAVWMGRLRNALRTAMLADPDPAEALAVCDRLMRLDAEDDEFSTALIALIDPRQHTMSCASAGHPGPLVWTTDGKISDPFSERNLPLGLRDLYADEMRRSQTVSMRPGSFAVFFTDGLLEWKRNIAESWDRLIDAIHRRDVRLAENPAKAIRRAVIDGERHQDDLAVLTVRVDEQGP